MTREEFKAVLSKDNRKAYAMLTAMLEAIVQANRKLRDELGIPEDWLRGPVGNFKVYGIREIESEEVWVWYRNGGWGYSGQLDSLFNLRYEWFDDQQAMVAHHRDYAIVNARSNARRLYEDAKRAVKRYKALGRRLDSVIERRTWPSLRAWSTNWIRRFTRYDEGRDHKPD